MNAGFLLLTVFLHCGITSFTFPKCLSVILEADDSLMSQEETNMKKKNPFNLPSGHNIQKMNILYSKYYPQKYISIYDVNLVIFEENPTVAAYITMVISVYEAN